MVPRAEHNRTVAALEGSSHLMAPWWWRWVLVGVETHHIHHVNARVPGYRMQVGVVGTRHGEACCVCGVTMALAGLGG